MRTRNKDDFLIDSIIKLLYSYNMLNYQFKNNKIKVLPFIVLY